MADHVHGHDTESTGGAGWERAAAAVDVLTRHAQGGKAARRVQNVLLYGPPGTGKSRFAQTYGLENERADHVDFGRLLHERRIARVYLTEETPAVELRGGPLPTGSEWHWVHGPVVSAWQQGSRLVLDEIDKASADALTFLLAALDDRAVAGMTLPTGEVVRPAPGFHVVATMNPAPDALPEALLDRFPVRVEIDEPHPGAIAALSPDLRVAARATAKLPSARRISIRSWSAYDDLRDAFEETLRHCGEAEELAAALVFGTRARDVLDALRIGADSDAWSQGPTCYWARSSRCRGDGDGVYRDSDGDPICRGCTDAGVGPGPVRTPHGDIVRE